MTQKTQKENVLLNLFQHLPNNGKPKFSKTYNLLILSKIQGGNPHQHCAGSSVDSEMNSE